MLGEGEAVARDRGPVRGPGRPPAAGSAGEPLGCRASDFRNVLITSLRTLCFSVTDFTNGSNSMKKIRQRLKTPRPQKYSGE